MLLTFETYRPIETINKILTGLVEERNTVSRSVVIRLGIHGRAHTMKRGLEAIIGPRHEQVANIADDVAGCREA